MKGFARKIRTWASIATLTVVAGLVTPALSAQSVPRLGSLGPVHLKPVQPGRVHLESVHLESGDGLDGEGGSFTDYVGGFAAGAGLGAVVGGGLGFLGSQLGDNNAQENPVGTVSGIVLGALGYTVGAALGVQMFGERRHGERSARSTYWGAALGLLAGTAIGFAQPGDNLNGVYLGMALTAPPAGAVIGFFR